jgi:putative transposase
VRNAELWRAGCRETCTPGSEGGVGKKRAGYPVTRPAPTLPFFYQFPHEHWPHLRTTNVVESPFATVRLRTTAAKRFKKVENATALIWKLLQVAESTFRRLKGAELLPTVYAGAQYSDGVPRAFKTKPRLAA